MTVDQFDPRGAALEWNGVGIPLLRELLASGGIEAYTYSNGQTRESLLESDPRLYELVRQVIPAHKMPGNVFVGRVRQPQQPRP